MAGILLRTEKNTRVLESLEKGDLVQFKRVIYSHWGVYVGNSDVVHFAGLDDKAAKKGRIFEKAVIRKENFFKVAKQDMAKKNNKRDEKIRPKDRDEIVKYAMKMLGNKDYNMCSNNCEHFANMCRYGVSKCDQVNPLLQKVSKAVTRSVTRKFNTTDITKKQTCKSNTTDITKTTTCKSKTTDITKERTCDCNTTYITTEPTCKSDTTDITKEPEQGCISKNQTDRALTLR